MIFEDGETKIRELNSTALIRAFRGYFLIGLTIALASPRSVLDSFYLFRMTVEIVSAFIPAVSKLASVSDIPEVVKFYWVAMCVGFPIVTFRVALLWTYSPRILNATAWTKFKTIFSWFVLVFLIGWLVVFFGDTSTVALPDNHGRGGAMIRAIVQTRIGLALFGGLLFCCFAFLVGVFARLFGIWSVNSIRRGTAT